MDQLITSSSPIAFTDEISTRLETLRTLINQGESNNWEEILDITIAKVKKDDLDSNDLNPITAQLTITGCEYQLVIEEYLTEIVSGNVLTATQVSLIPWTIKYLLKHELLYSDVSLNRKLKLWLSIFSMDDILSTRRVEIAEQILELLKVGKQRAAEREKELNHTSLTSS